VAWLPVDPSPRGDAKHHRGRSRPRTAAWMLATVARGRRRSMTTTTTTALAYARALGSRTRQRLASCSLEACRSWAYPSARGRGRDADAPALCPGSGPRRAAKNSDGSSSSGSGGATKQQRRRRCSYGLQRPRHDHHDPKQRRLQGLLAHEVGFEARMYLASLLLRSE